MKKKISLKDLASEANVSTAAISYVLNGQENRVSPAVAARIKALATKYKYRPHHIARSLKTRRTNTIGLVVANISYRFTTGITSAIEAEAKKHNFSVLIGSSDEDLTRFSELVNVLLDREVDGLILLPTDNAEKEVRSLVSAEVPMVLLDRYYPSINTSFIALDNYSAVRDQVTYLADLGHTHVAFINYETTMHHLVERTRGYSETVKKFRLPGGKKWNRAIRREHMQGDLKKAISEICSSGAAKPAIIFASDTLAIQGIRMITDLGLRIPEDMSVLSFDESESFELFSCKITHGKQPLEEMGKTAVNALINLMDDRKLGRKLLLQSDLVVGQSCGEN